MTEQESLQKQIDELRGIVDRLQAGETKYMTPAQYMRKTKEDALSKYYGTWEQFRDTEIQCVPYGKKWNDRDFLRTGCSKLTDIIFKHGNDFTASSNICGLVRTREDMELYEEIAEYVVSCVYSKVKEIRERKGYEV